MPTVRFLPHRGMGSHLPGDVAEFSPEAAASLVRDGYAEVVPPGASLTEGSPANRSMTPTGPRQYFTRQHPSRPVTEADVAAMGF